MNMDRILLHLHKRKRKTKVNLTLKRLGILVRALIIVKRLWIIKNTVITLNMTTIEIKIKLC